MIPRKPAKKKKRTKRTDTKVYQKKQFNKLVNKAYRLWTQAIRDIFKDKCFSCKIKNGTPSGVNQRPVRLNCHHIEDKGNWALRFSIFNGVLVCPTCHKFGIDSAHKSPVWFLNQIPKHIKEKVLKYRIGPLPQRKGDWTLEMIEGVIKELEEFLRE